MTSFLSFLKKIGGLPNVTNLTVDELSNRAVPFGRKTDFGNLSFSSTVRSRSASQSVVFGSERVQEKNLTPGQARIAGNLSKTLSVLKEYIMNTPIVSVQRTIGDNKTFNPKCTLYLSTQRPDNIRQAYLWSKTLRDYDSDSPGPELTLICIPEWPEHDRQVLVFPEDGFTIVLGMDYVGEVKMGFLRMAMWYAKQEGMLSLHAGSKLLNVKPKGSPAKRYGMLLFGLSGTGKTTHSCHNHGLTGTEESIEILQDDIVFLNEDGSALGTEQGFYLKTEGVRQENQPIILNGLSSPDVLFENVMVDNDGNVKMNDLTLGSNGRAVMSRNALSPHISKSINMPPLEALDGLIIAFVTRRMTVLPIVSKLNAEEAAKAFMLGESIETSAGDPKRAGESVRVVGTNPFMIGEEEDEGKWFYSFLKKHRDKIQCFLLNTGGVGEIIKTNTDGTKTVKQKPCRVSIPEMSSIIGGIIRDTIEWTEDPYFRSTVPAKVEGVDIEKFEIKKFYDANQIQNYVDTLESERDQWLSQFPDLPKEIVI